MPPTLFVSNEDSLAERIQAALPDTNVVKALNTINANVMVNPGRVPGETDVFVCGNDAGAKAQVIRILKQDFGWTTVIDLGDLTAARGTESYLHLWLRLMGSLKTADFNVKVVH